MGRRARELLADEQNRPGSPSACENTGEQNGVFEGRGESASVVSEKSAGVCFIVLWKHIPAVSLSKQK